MGIFKMIGKKGAARALASSAHEAFIKYKTDNPGFSEAEIAEELFKQRCLPGNLNKEEKVRYDKYTGKEQKVDTLFKLCMAMIYILCDVTEDDARTYQSIRKIIEEELSGSGHNITSALCTLNVGLPG